jgi:hypothetical protein
MSVFENQKKKRFQLLSYVYESSEANTERAIYLRDIVKNTNLSQNEVVSIAGYLIEEKGFLLCEELLRLDPDLGIVWITPQGITEIESQIED